MEVERKKRKEAAALLEAFSRFRRAYLLIEGDVDFPNNRLTFCSPELAFPVLSAIATLWNAQETLFGKHGRLALYPVARSAPKVHDSILNFWELWNNPTPEVGASLVVSGEEFYFEINEDYDLNLKLEASMLREDLCEEVHRRLLAVKWPNGIQDRPRQYRQETFVLYEVDFGLLENVRDIEGTARRLATAVDLIRSGLA
jgi:hypothetical protein